jgi:hypothetical protein
MRLASCRHKELSTEHGDSGDHNAAFHRNDGFRARSFLSVRGILRDVAGPLTIRLPLGTRLLIAAVVGRRAVRQPHLCDHRGRALVAAMRSV